jgi:hypothetical protein
MSALVPAPQVAVPPPLLSLLLPQVVVVPLLLLVLQPLQPHPLPAPVSLALRQLLLLPTVAATSSTTR